MKRAVCICMLKRVVKMSVSSECLRGFLFVAKGRFYINSYFIVWISMFLSNEYSFHGWTN